MNYQKKRKRQNGRQEQKPRSIFNEWERLHSQIDKLIEEGILPRLDFNPEPVMIVGFGSPQG